MTSQRIYRLSRYGNLLLLQAALNGIYGSVKQVRLLVDTGSTQTIVRVKTLEELGCDMQNPLRRTSFLAAGGIISAPVVAVRWFNCLGQRVENFPIVAYTIPPTSFVEGLLGMDFLTRVQAIVDVGKAEIRCPISTQN